MSFWITILSICMRGISFVVDIITFIPFYIIDNPSKKLKLSRRLKAKPVIESDPSSPYRSLDLHNGLTVTPVDNCYTVDDLFEHATSLYSDLPSLGTRELLHEEEEIQSSGKIFKKAVYGNYSWLTFLEVKDSVVKIGRGLLELNSSPTVCIYADTCAKWIITAFACFKLKAPIITLYATLGEEAIRHGLAETDVDIVVTSAENVNKLKKIIDHLKQLKCIVYFEGAKKPDLDDFKDTNIKVLSFSELEKIGTKALNNLGPITQKPSQNDLAVIMYTSGSTGQPKGVMMSHKNICASLSGIMQFCTGVGPSDTYVAYLPLAHIFELAAEIGCFSHGAKIGFSSPNTLADQSTKIKRGSKGDVSILRPTLMALVPVIMDRMYKSVWDKVNNSGEWKKSVFKFAYGYKKKWYLAGYSTPLIDRFVFKSLKKMMGGNLRMMVAGGAPLSRDTHIFMNICFCCPISQGYGLTETCGGGTIQLPDDLSTGRVGVPITCCEIKLVDWDEGGYRATDRPHPRGEVWISGENVTMGYYKNPQKTKEDYKMVNGQRWFATGDIGVWEPDGCLRIIDRKKDLVKLQAGEYISFGKVETALCLSPYIDNICMWADSSKDYAIAFILPNRKHVVQLAETLEIKESDCNKLLDEKKLNTAVLKHIQEFGLKAKLEKFEVPVKVLLVKEQWSPDSGFLTDSFKLKRKFIERFYAKEISQMYDD